MTSTDLRPFQPTNHAPFSSGDQILLRFVRNHPADVIAPVTVVRDTPAEIALFIQVGTPLKVQASATGERLTRDTPFLERDRMVAGLADRQWTDNAVLMLHQPGRFSTVWLMWRAVDWTFRGWYINLQAPLARTQLGFDTADYMLDIDVAPDFSWQWKDEDEFHAAREHGLVVSDLLDAVRAEGERMIDELEARRWPFDTAGQRYLDWKPDPGWTIPQLPDNWAEGLRFPTPNTAED